MKKIKLIVISIANNSNWKKNQEIEVKPSYAKYLIEKKIAINYDEKGLNLVKQEENEKKENLKKQEELNKLTFNFLNKKEFTFYLNQNNSLYGSISSNQIINKINKTLKDNFPEDNIKEFSKDNLINFIPFEKIEKREVKLRVKNNLIATLIINVSSKTIK